MFDRAGVQAGITYQLHTFGWDVRDKPGDEVEGRTGNGLSRAGGSVTVPVDDLLAVVSAQM
jgi:hypothetical protein